jgi:hypothetical protein
LIGPSGLHRLYLTGRFDGVARALFAASVLGSYGIYRARSISVDDQLSWLLIPLLGFAIAGCALAAIFYGLMDSEKWAQRFDSNNSVQSSSASTNWITVIGIASALFIGTTALMASLAFTFQRYFEYQVEGAKELTQARDHHSQKIETLG